MINPRLMFIAGVICTLTACDSGQDTVVAEQLRPVRVFEVSGANTGRTRTFSGISQSSQESRLSFKVGGTIIDLPIQVGSVLSVGDTVARLDSSTFDLEVEQARAKLIQAQASERNAESNYSRVKGLYENSNASKNDLDAARANAETAQAEARAANKAVEIAELNRSYTHLRAANNCSVASVAVERNENINAGTEVVTVNCGEGIEVRLGIPAGLVSRLGDGMPASVQFNTISNRQFRGSVSEIGVGAASSASTFPVVVSLEETDSQIRPGMAAQVSFAFAGDSNAQTYYVPAASVAKDSEGTFVFLAVPQQDDQAVITRRTVELGELTGQGLEVIGGLQEGDRIVTAGLSFLRDGKTVLLP